MVIQNLLTKKAADIYTINEKKTLVECLAILNEKRIGILVVLDDSGKFTGLVSERDVLRTVGNKGQEYAKILAKDVMTPLNKVYSVQKDEHFEKVMTYMTEKRVRHIPVMDGEKIIGIVSIGDLLKNLLESAQFENEQLKNYISGGY
ncbi:MAG: CBS domain-containing protein [Spirochaetes bacterium]|nr:CBS domain-containing protein [Spirochaetota bacterium]